MRITGLAWLLAPAFAFSAAGPKPLPDLHLRDLGGEARTLSSLRGHLAVVNFWATWCSPCREELPRLSRLSQAYAGNGVTFVAVSLDEKKSRGDIPGAVSQAHLHFPVWTGASLDTLEQLKLGNVVPATVIVDETGAPICRIEGEAQDTDIRTALDWALGGRHGPPPPAVVRRY